MKTYHVFRRRVLGHDHIWTIIAKNIASARALMNRVIPSNEVERCYVRRVGR